MSAIEVTAKKGDREVKVNYDFGDDLNASVELFGEGVVHSQYAAQAKVRCQAIMRAGIDAGKTDEDIQGIIASWKPGTKISIGADPKQAFMAAFAGMSKEEKAEVLKELRSK